MSALDRDENHHLEQVPCPVRPDDKPTIWILPGVLSGKRMVDGMTDVFVGYTVLTSRRVDLHKDLVYYENKVWYKRHSVRGDLRTTRRADRSGTA